MHVGVAHSLETWPAHPCALLNYNVHSHIDYMSFSQILSFVILVELPYFIPAWIPSSFLSGCQQDEPSSPLTTTSR